MKPDDNINDINMNLITQNINKKEVMRVLMSQETTTWWRLCGVRESESECDSDACERRDEPDAVEEPLEWLSERCASECDELLFDLDQRAPDSRALAPFPTPPAAAPSRAAAANRGSSD